MDFLPCGKIGQILKEGDGKIRERDLVRKSQGAGLSPPGARSWICLKWRSWPQQHRFLGDGIGRTHLNPGAGSELSAQWPGA